MSPSLTSPGRIFEQGRIHRVCWKVHIAHNAAANEDVLDGTLKARYRVSRWCTSAIFTSVRECMCVRRKDTCRRGCDRSVYFWVYVPPVLPKEQTLRTHEMGILDFFDHGDVVQFDVQVLIDALESATDGDVVFELHRDLMAHQGFEEAEE